MMRSGLNEFGNVGSFNFFIERAYRLSQLPCRSCFLSNKNDEKKFLTPGFAKQVAQRIVAGIEDFLKNL